MKPKTALGIALAWLVGVIVHLSFYYHPFSQGSMQEFTVMPGSSNAMIARSLAERELGGHPRLILAYLYLTNQKNLQAGEYLFEIGSSIRDLVQSLTQRIAGRRVTFPEGFTSDQMAALLEATGICSAENYLEQVHNPARFQRAWLEDADTLEGFLFPDTYSFVPATDVSFIIETQLDRFEEVFLGPFLAHKGDLSLRDTVILASLVEKETKTQHERPLVASVFLNRLKKGMRLQSCATVVYAIRQETGQHRNALSLDDLRFDSPYNTYLVDGLPHAPIGNPGLESLLAAVQPVPSDYLYFVLQETGEHAFSRTYQEHLDNRDAAAQ